MDFLRPLAAFLQHWEDSKKPGMQNTPRNSSHVPGFDRMLHWIFWREEGSSVFDLSGGGGGKPYFDASQLPKFSLTPHWFSQKYIVVA